MKKNYLQDKQYHFGLDYLSIYGTFHNEKIFRSLNFTNSHYGELEDYVYSKDQVPKYQYGIKFLYKNYPVFLYTKGDPTLHIPSYDTITVYGVAFKILPIEEILSFLERNFDLVKVKRFDICIDLNDDIQKVLKKFKSLSQRGGNIYGKGGVIETCYIGNTNKVINKRQIIRIYNKLRDIKSSKKEQLYLDYFMHDHMTRVEVEFRRDLAGNIYYKDLFDEKVLKALFKNYTRKHTKIFDTLCEEKLSLYKKVPVIQETAAQIIYYTKLYRQGFLGYARAVLRMGACPVKVLIGEDVVRESTKKELGIDSFEEMYQAEKKLKEEALLNQDGYGVK